MLARHGYGVLLLEPRGQGSSEGDIVRWAGDRDLLARPRTSPRSARRRSRLASARSGFSIGGELLIEAAAQSSAISAVVSEGAGERVGEIDASGLERILAAPAMAVMTAAMTVFQNHRPPPPIVERIGLISPRRSSSSTRCPGQGGEAGTTTEVLRRGARAEADLESPRLVAHGWAARRSRRTTSGASIEFFDRSLLRER